MRSYGRKDPCRRENCGKIRDMFVAFQSRNVAFSSPAGKIEVCKNGASVEFSEEVAKKILLEKEITVLVALNDGDACASAWGCDLTYDYVKINGDYRT